MKREPLQSMRKALLTTNQAGFSLVEVILSTAVFVLLVTALVGAYLYGQEATALAGNRARATMLAEEGLEAVRNIKDANFSNLSDGTHGLAVSGNQWTLSGSSDVTDIFTRSISISIIDMDRKSVVSNISWQQNPQRTGSLSLATRFTNRQASAASPASCNDYAVQQGYSVGTCRQNTQQCTNNGETYLSGGDSNCVTDF